MVSCRHEISSSTAKQGIVFHYTFEWPLLTDTLESTQEPATARRSSKSSWSIMWDYENGLVRTTAFFKSLGYPKTEPKKAISATKGLDKVCHSITGGRVEAQGYWIPFDAARELATNFTYDIRYALVPVFGPDFPDLCLAPEDPAFKRWKLYKYLALCASQTIENREQTNEQIEELRQDDEMLNTKEDGEIVARSESRGYYDIASNTKASPIHARNFTPVNQKHKSGVELAHNGTFIRSPPHGHSTQNEDSRRGDGFSSTKRPRSPSLAAEERAQFARYDEVYRHTRINEQYHGRGTFRSTEIQVARILENMKNCGRWYPS